mmetsp:Transcript_124657/g.358047  ORF Transcript_124657/g.358047 Transcript_124657/m.358047 type:complete len:247 (+) Transcript_124657:191-931(+)
MPLIGSPGSARGAVAPRPWRRMSRRATPASSFFRPRRARSSRRPTWRNCPAPASRSSSGALGGRPARTSPSAALGLRRRAGPCGASTCPSQRPSASRAVLRRRCRRAARAGGRCTCPCPRKLGPWRWSSATAARSGTGPSQAAATSWRGQAPSSCKAASWRRWSWQHTPLSDSATAWRRARGASRDFSRRRGEAAGQAHPPDAHKPQEALPTPPGVRRASLRFWASGSITLGAPAPAPRRSGGLSG